MEILRLLSAIFFGFVSVMFLLTFLVFFGPSVWSGEYLWGHEFADPGTNLVGLALSAVSAWIAFLVWPNRGNRK